MNPELRTPQSHPCPACGGAGFYFEPEDLPDVFTRQCAACLGDGIDIDRRTLRHEEPSCRHCGSTEDPYFSRIMPMGYFCPACGKEDT
jgi:hypothetical protein